MLQKVKIVNVGENQLLQLPDNVHFSEDEAYIQKTGSAFLIVPKGKEWETFLEGLNGFTEDYFKTVEKHDIYQKEQP